MLKPIVLTVAISTATPAAATSYTGESYDVLGGLSSTITSCRTDAQCAVADGVPCGCAMGGKQVAINKRYVPFWHKLQADVRTLPLACPALYRCQPKAEAYCAVGHCTTAHPLTDTVGVLPPPSSR